MSGHEEKLIDPSESEDISIRVEIEEDNDTIRQPLEPVVIVQSSASRFAQSMSPQLEELVSSGESKTVHVSESLPSLLSSLDYDIPTDNSTKAHSWPRTSSKSKIVEGGLRIRPSGKRSVSLTSFPKASSADASTYSTRSMVLETESTVSSEPQSEANPYMRGVIWCMASAAIMVCALAIVLILHSIYRSTDAPPALETADPSEPPVVIDLDLDMGTS